MFAELCFNGVRFAVHFGLESLGVATFVSEVSLDALKWSGECCVGVLLLVSSCFECFLSASLNCFVSGLRSLV